MSSVSFDFSSKNNDDDESKNSGISYLNSKFCDSKSQIYWDDIKRNVYSVKIWLFYLNDSTIPSCEKNTLFTEALFYLPRSYKIWMLYLDEKLSMVIDKHPMSDEYSQMNEVFESCLLHLSSMPLIWIMYLDFLCKQPLITKVRRTFDRCLQSLSLTQHYLIWPRYLKFVDRVDVPITSLVVYKRYLLLEPGEILKYIDLLKKLGRHDEAAKQLASALNSDSSSYTREKYDQLWNELCDLVTSYPHDIHSIDVESVLKSGLRKFTNQVSKFWCVLAQYYTALGHTEKARDIFELALESVWTTYDFGVVFDAYVQFFESMLNGIISSDNPDSVQIDLYIEKLEFLIKRRPFLLSSLKIRQSPNSVANWLHRISLYEPNSDDTIKCYTEALIKIDPLKYIGRLSVIWTQFAEHYEKLNDLKNAFAVYERAIQSKFRLADDLVRVWCSYAEMALRNQKWRLAMEISRRSVFTPSSTHNLNNPSDESGYHQHNLCRMNVLWSLCVDLEQSFGNLTTLEACYDKMFDIRVITPNQVLSFCIYLEERNYWEKAFSIYERAVAVFRWPHLYDVWLMYLAKFVSRYGGKKLERARELFEQVLLDVPKHLSKRFFLMYGKLEESHGLARHAVTIYDKASQCLALVEDIYDFYILVIAKTSEYFGITKTRPFFEKGIQDLSSQIDRWPFGIKLALEFINVERNLGEIDRARAIFKQVSQIAYPKKYPDFWLKWREFEVAHGNEDLFREMLRIKRSVQALFSEEEAKNTESLVMAAQAVVDNADTACQE